MPSKPKQHSYFLSSYFDSITVDPTTFMNDITEIYPDAKLHFTIFR
jgi:hypothetical protein